MNDKRRNSHQPDTTPEAAVGTCGAVPLMTVGEIAAYLKVPVTWVYERTRRRGVERIPGFRLGKYWRFQLSDVLAWIERQRGGGQANT